MLHCLCVLYYQVKHECWLSMETFLKVLQSLEVLASRLHAITVLLLDVELSFSLVYLSLYIFRVFLIFSALFYKFCFLLFRIFCALFIDQ